MTKVTAGNWKAFVKLPEPRLDRQSAQQVASAVRQNESKRLIILVSRGGSFARQGIPGPRSSIAAPQCIPRAATCFKVWDSVESN